MNEITSTLSSTIQMCFIPTSLYIPDVIQSSFYVIMNDVLSIDLSTASSSNPTTYPLKMSISCPKILFNSDDDYNSMCNLNNQKFSLDSSKLNVIFNYPYSFYFFFIASGSSIFQNNLAQVYFVKDSSDPSCPVVTTQTVYSATKQSFNDFQIIPSIVLSCNGNAYNIILANWTMVDSLSGTDQSSILSYGKQTVYRYANISAYHISQLVAGATFNVSVTYTFETVIAPKTQSTKTVKTQLLLQQQPFVPVLTAYNQNYNELSQNTLNFNEQLLIISAAKSYDPDNSSAVLSFQWTCPSNVEQLVACSTLVKGNQSQLLQINALQRAKFMFEYNTPYSFSVTVTSNNPYKVPITQSISITFNPPQYTDSNTNTLMPSACDTLSIPVSKGSVYYYNQTYPKLVQYTTANYSSISIQVVTTSQSSCSQGTIQDQLIYIYAFGAFFDSVQPMKFIYEQNTTTSILNSLNFNYVLGTYFDLLSQKSLYYNKVNVYMYTSRSGSTDNISLSVDTFYINRQLADLVAQLPASISVDKYSNLIISASSSYDPESLNNPYTYQWKCPNSVNCSNQTTSVLNLTTYQRANGQSNTNAISYTYQVIMVDPLTYRFSSPASVTVLITQQSDYSNCLSSSIDSTYLIGYGSSNNQTLILEFNQNYPSTIIFNVQKSCDAVNFETISYSTSPSIQTFWTVETSAQNEVTLTNTQFNSLLVPGITYPLYMNQQYSMGLDTTVKYNSINYVNVALALTDLVIQIINPRFVIFNSTNTQFNVVGSSSYDPVQKPFTYQWNCPSYFGGNGCSSSSTLTLTQDQLTSASNSQLSTYYNQSHKFQLVVTSNDKIRSTSKNFFVYLTDSNQQIFSDMENNQCSIQIQNSNTQEVISFAKVQIFSFSCSDTTLTQSIIDTYTLVWKIDSLNENTDYFQINEQLYLNPFIASSKLASSQEIIISLYISEISLTPIKASFKLKQSSLNYDSAVPNSNNPTVSILPVSNSQLTHSSLYSLDLTQFASNYGYGIMVQLRGYSQIFKSNYHIYAPIPILATTLSIFYSSLSIPAVSTLNLDFYDLNHQYLGTFNLITNGPFTNIQQGSFNQDDYEQRLNTLISTEKFYYDNSLDSPDRYKYQQDLEEVYILSEALYLNIVKMNSQTSAETTSTYAHSLLMYALNPFSYVISSLFENNVNNFIKEQKDQVEIKALLITSLLTSISEDYLDLIEQVLSLLEFIEANYSTITTYGDDQQALRTSIISIVKYTQVQISNLPDSNQNKVLYNTRNTNVKSWIIGSDYNTLTPGQQNQTLVGNVNRASLLLDSSSSSYTQIKNQQNAKEIIVIPSQQLLSQQSVNAIEVTFGKQSNDSSPVSTVLNINAYDSNYNILELNLQSTSSGSSTVQQGTTFLQYMLSQIKREQQDRNLESEVIFANENLNYIYFSLVAKDSFQQQFSDTLNNNDSTTYMYPSCVYYDEVNGGWSTQGVQNVSYDYDTGILNCSTTHLSSFSMDYVILKKSDSNTDNTTDPTVSQYYFRDPSRVKYFYIAVGVVSFITILFIILSILITKTEWDYKNPQIEKLQEGPVGCCGACLSTCLLHHILISACCGPKKANIHLTLPKVSKMIDIWWLFFAILAALGLTMWQMPELLITGGIDFKPRDIQTFKDDMNAHLENLVLCGMVMGGIYAGRIIVLTLGYAIYFIGKGPDNIKGQERTSSSLSNTSKSNKQKGDMVSQFETGKGASSDLEENLVKKPKKKKGKKKGKKKSKSKGMRGNSDTDDMQYEGGSSDEEKPKKQKMRSGVSSDINSGKKSKSKNINYMNKTEKGFSGDEGMTSSSQQPKKKYEKNMNQDLRNAQIGSKSGSMVSVRFFLIQQTFQDSKMPQNNPVEKRKMRNEDFAQNKQKLFVEDNKYQQMTEKPKKPKKKSASRHPRERSESPIVEEYKHEGEAPLKKKKKKRVSRGSKSTSPTKVNYGIQNMSTKINSSVEYGTEEERISEKKKPKSRQMTVNMDPVSEVDDVQIIGQYSKSKWCTFALKFLLLLGCMAITYWMMWQIVDLPHLWSWMAMTGVVFFIWIIIISPLFIIIYAIFFKITGGKGCCLKIAQIVLLGNAHSNVANGILYSINN